MQEQIALSRWPDKNALSAFFPGLLAAITIAMAAAFLSENYGGPVMLFALLLGIAFNFSSEPGGRCIPGIEIASKKVLRIGVALLGIRISFAEIDALGYQPVILILGSVLTTILFGMLLARVLGLWRNFGILTGGAVAICGASAALALSAVLPKNSDSERDTIFTVVGVTALSTIAMIVYPIIVALIDLDNSLAGVFLGATIHDVAQVVGAGYTISDQSGDVATLVKLMRVAMLVPLVFVLALILRDKSQAPSVKNSIPLFLIGFVALVLANNLLTFPDIVVEKLAQLSRWCLIIAIAALGMKTSLKQLADVGGKAILLIVLETLYLAILVLVITKFYW